MDRLLLDIGNAIWGPFMLLLLLGTGVFFTFRLKGITIRKLGYALKTAFTGGKAGAQGDITPFQSLTTMLAATIGTGNIAGVATAMAAGGPGALFWMWVTAVFGMATAYAESLLAVRFRKTGPAGMVSGGPMYVLRDGVRNKRAGRALSCVYALFAVLVSLGTGNITQANTVSLAVRSLCGVDPPVTGAVIAVLSALVIAGGIKSIARATEKLVPFMGAFYILGGLVVVCMHPHNLIPGLTGIFRGAFSAQSAAGGFAGASVAAALQSGVARGLFSNEAGMGSAAIAAAAAKTDHPARQGFVSMTAVFFDTIVVCTVTGLAIAATGAWRSGLSGVDMVILAFEKGMPGLGAVVVTVATVLFAFCTIVGWEFFGEKALAFLLGERAALPYRYAYCGMAFAGSLFALRTVWALADIFNAMMALPNLIGLILLYKTVVRETDGFMRTVYEKEKKRTRIALRRRPD